MPKSKPPHDADAPPLVFLHVGDLHLTGAEAPNARDLRAILGQVAGIAPRSLFDFVYLPGDLAEDGTAEQYAVLSEALAAHPDLEIRLIPGDHDRQHGAIAAFDGFFRAVAGSARGGGREPVVNQLPRPEETCEVAQYYAAETIRGVRCLFVDIVSAGFSRKGIGLDFRLGRQQTQWLSRELVAAAEARMPCAVFMHAYPDDLREPDDRLDVAGLIRATGVRLVEMGHTHYNELAHDGRTLYAAARSVGQNEDGSVGYAVGAIDGPVTSWRFRALDRQWPFVLITSPADRRVATQPANADGTGMVRDGHDRVRVRALVLSDEPPDYVHCRADTGPWILMRATAARCYAAWLAWPGDARAIQVEAVHRLWPGYGPDFVDTDVIEPVTAFADPGTAPSPVQGRPGSDDASLGAWLQKGVRGDRLGPNRSGRKW